MTIRTRSPIQKGLSYHQRATTLTAVSLAVSSLCAATGVRAADATTGQSASSEDSTVLEEVIVTGTKREENLQEVDVSVSVLTVESLEARNITDAGQLNGLAPSVSIQPSFILLTYIRGLGNYSSQPGVDQSVAYNSDGIYISKPYGIPNVLFDLERVEMLRGPQGTLQGRNAAAGSIDLITAKPTETFSGRASVGFGNYHAVNTEAMVNIPLSDGYAIRFAGATSEHEGFFKNGYGDQNVSGARARLLMRPNDKLEAVLTGEYSQRNEKGWTYSPCPPGSTTAQGCAGVKWNPWAGSPGQGTSDTTNMNEPNMLVATNYAVYANVTYDLDFATLTWVPNYRDWDYKNHQSLSGAFGYAPAVKDKTHSQELRLASNSGSPVTWVGGLYYAREEAQEQNYFTTNAGPFVTIDRPGFPSIGHVYYKNDVNKYVYESKSVFGQAAFPLVENLRLIAGFRYTKDLKTHAGNAGIVVAAPITGLPQMVSADVGGRLSTNKFTYKAGFEYDLTPQHMLYANISTAYKAGGVNGVPPGSGIPATFKPEDMTAIQGGVKSRFWGDRAQINFEGFHYDYTGYQTSFFAVTSQGVLIGGSTNSQKAEFYGGELEGSFLITPKDQVDFGITYLSAIYKEFVIPANGANLNGYRLQNAPKSTLTGNYSHTFDLAGGSSLVAHAEAHWEAGQWVDYRHSDGSYTKAHWRNNVDLTYKSADERYKVSAYVQNIFNDDALVVANAGLGPYMLGQPYPPRTFGIRATASF
jgi:iron complex outermembrane receptor protein